MYHDNTGLGNSVVADWDVDTYFDPGRGDYRDITRGEGVPA